MHMKSIRIPILVFAVSGLFALVPAGAQTNPPAHKPSPPPPETRRVGPDARLNALNTALALTDEQKPKVKEVFEEEAKQRQEARDALRTSTPEDRRAKIQAINEQTTARLKAILTPEQFTKYQGLTRSHGQGGGPRPNGEKKPQNQEKTPPQ